MKRRFLCAVLLLLASCESQSSQTAKEMTGGDPQRGAMLIRQYGCGSCHHVPRVAGAVGTAGAPLDGFAKRQYVAGVLSNNPQNLMRWIQDPPGIEPKTAMPNVGVTAEDARDLAAFLYTLK